MSSARSMVIVAGFAPHVVSSMVNAFPDATVLVVEDEQVVTRPAIAASIEKRGGVGLGWSYTHETSADVFYHQHRDLDVRAVIPGLEYAVTFATRLAERYGVPGASLGTARILRDKAALRAVANAAGLRNPASERVADLAGVLDFIRRHPGPVVVKPANRQGSVGTRIVRSEAQAREAWQSALDQREAEYVAYQGLPLLMLVEEFIDGIELSVEVLVRSGETQFANVTGKLLHPGDCPVELGHVVPAEIAPAEWDMLVAETEKVVAAVGMDTGVAHCEWIIRDGEPYLVECAGRMPGDGLVELIDHAWQVDMVGAYAQIMTGKPMPPMPSSPAEAAAVLYPAVAPGVVRSVDGTAQAAAVKGVFRSGCAVKPGDQVRAIRSSWDRVMGAAAYAPTVAEALAAAKEATGLIRIVTVPVED